MSIVLYMYKPYRNMDIEACSLRPLLFLLNPIKYQGTCSWLTKTIISTYFWHVLETKNNILSNCVSLHVQFVQFCFNMMFIVHVLVMLSLWIYKSVLFNILIIFFNIYKMFVYLYNTWYQYILVKYQFIFNVIYKYIRTE